MKRFNWTALPGVIVTLYFIYIGITISTSNVLYACVWLFISSFGFYRSFCVFIGKPSNTTKTFKLNSETKTSNRLNELTSLYDQGLITREEFEEKREKILNEL